MVGLRFSVFRACFVLFAALGVSLFLVLLLFFATASFYVLRGPRVLSRASSFRLRSLRRSLLVTMRSGKFRGSRSASPSVLSLSALSL